MGVRKVVPISNLAARHARGLVRWVRVVYPLSGGSVRSHRSAETRRHGPSVQHTAAVPSMQQHQGQQKPTGSDAQASPVWALARERSYGKIQPENTTVIGFRG